MLLYLFVLLQIIICAESQNLDNQRKCSCLKGLFNVTLNTENFDYSSILSIFNCVCELSQNEKNLISNISAQYNLTIPVKDQVEVVENIKAAQRQIESNNLLFAQNLSNFESQFYEHNAYTRIQMKNLLGAIPPKQNTPKPLALPLFTIDGLPVEIPLQRSKRAVNSPLPQCQNLPVYKNWVEEGKTTPVRHQGICGSCYIHSSTEVLESTVAIDYRTQPLKLSVQHTFECIKNLPGKSNYNACDGGSVTWVFDYARDQKGVVAESMHTLYNQNPNATCRTDLPRDTRAEVDFWQRITYGDEEAMKCHLANRGPISVSILTEKTSIMTYKSGIWDDPEGNCKSATSTDHAVYLVGYGTEVGQTGEVIDYWLVQNSWGSAYGMGGFIKMKRGVNLCLIATNALYAVLKSSTPKPLEPTYPPTDCIFSGDVYNSNGAYVKSFCADNYARNHENSRINCLQRGMRLYQFDSTEANATLMNSAESKWTNNRIAVELFVSGRNDISCNGIFNNNPFGPFRVIDSNCSKTQRSVCEYINYQLYATNKPTTTTTTTKPTTTTTKATTTTTTTKPTTTTTTTKPTTTTTTTKPTTSTTTTKPTTTTTTTQPATTTTTTKPTTSTTTTKPTTTTTTTKPTSTMTTNPFLLNWPSHADTIPYLLNWPTDGFCTFGVDITESNNRYIKTLCTHLNPLTQESARNNCASRQMQLFRFSSFYDDPSQLSYELSVLAMNKKTTNPYWVDGGNSTTGLAVYYTSAGIVEKVYLPVTRSLFSFCQFQRIPKSLTDDVKSNLNSKCLSIKLLRNLNGQYLKTVCLGNTKSDYDGALTFCTSNQMTILKVDSAEVSTELIAHTRTLSVKGSFWIEGKTATGCSTLDKPEVASSYSMGTVACGNSYYAYCQIHVP